MEGVSGPSDNKMFMKALLTANAKEDGKFKQYLMQCKQETAKRMMDILYNPEWGTLDLKWWLQYHRKYFLNLKFN